MAYAQIAALKNFAIKGSNGSGYSTNLDGASPGLVVLVGSMLYGSCYNGNTNGSGTLFSISTNGVGFTVLRSFAKQGSFVVSSHGTTTNLDGVNPVSTLQISSGIVYGATTYGTTNGSGAIFRMNIDGSGFTNIYVFKVSTGTASLFGTNSDGANPLGGLVLAGTTLYGTAGLGGVNGNGSVFRLNLDGSGFTNLHNFAAGVGSFPDVTNSDGATPNAMMAFSNNVLYGTTVYGGTNGRGVVFKMNTDGSGFANLHTFDAGTGVNSGVVNANGSHPSGSLLLSGGKIYGQTQFGGTAAYGILFSLNLDGSGFANLHAFAAGTGAYPNYTNLEGANPNFTLLNNGALYGTAIHGGAGGGGAAFRINLDGTGFTNFFNYPVRTGTAPLDTNVGGAYPIGLALLGSTFFGASSRGGAMGSGTIYSLAAGGTVSGQTFPTVTKEPSDTNAPVGGIAFFSVTATGGSLHYQWSSNSVALPNETNSTLTIANVTLGHDGSRYSVAITNSAGAYITRNALLTVFVPTTSIVAWGLNGSGQTNIPPGLNGVIAVAAGGGHSVALKNDGTVVAWGDNSLNQTNVPPGLSGVSAVKASGNLTIAIRTNGTIAVWGESTYAQTAVPAGLSNVTSVAFGSYHLLALRQNGTVSAWGYSPQGQTNIPSNLSNVVAIAAGYYHSLALKGDGTIVAWGDNSLLQTNVPAGLSNVVAIAVGSRHNLALLGTGAVISWGKFYNGSSDTNASTPAGVSNIVSIAAGIYSSFALKSDGTVHAWGTFYDSGIFSPATVPLGLNKVLSLQCGAWHTLSLKNDGGLVAWGNNFSGETNTPSALTNVLAVAAGSSHSLAILGQNAAAPFLVSSPSARTNAARTTGLFAAVASGTPLLNYQWRINGTNLEEGGKLSGSKTPFLTLINVQQTNAGIYTVVVSNGFGMLTSSPASFGVGPPIGFYQIVPVKITAGQLQFSFIGNTNGKYALERSLTLPPQNWVTFVTNQADADGNVSFTNTPLATTNNFWRIRLVP